MRKSRHLLDEHNQRFVRTVLETSEKRQRIIEKDSILWRAQLGITCELVAMPGSLSLHPDPDVEMVEIEMPRPLESKRMVPLKDRAGEGRVNPKGIPCLYLSTDRDTAMTEVRPWMGSGISVGQFIVLRNLNIVDCSMDTAKTISLRAGPKKEAKVWRDINRSFSEPVTRSDDIAEYAPTQILAEAFRSAGYDGVVYGSKLGIGKTVAIFDLNAAELVNCEGFRVESVKLELVPLQVCTALTSTATLRMAKYVIHKSRIQASSQPTERRSVEIMRNFTFKRRQRT